MKWWLLAVLLLPGGSAILVGAWLRRRWVARDAAAAAQIAALIHPPAQRFTGHDEAMEARARARREIAESVKRRSALIASGSSAGSVLKIARKA